jgi:Cu/Zn superoxide dismutase
MKISSVLSALLTVTTLGFAVTHAQTMKSDTMSNIGKLITVNAPTSGTLEIQKNSDGSRILHIKNLKTEAGPDLHVYLYAASIPAKDAKNVKATKFVDLGKLAAPFKGNYNYKIPSNVKLEQFKSVIIWCDVAKVTFAGANLK